MAREVKCIICGKVFTTEHRNKKYCSLVCKDASIRKKRLEWKINNPDYYKEYFKKRREENA